MKTTLLLLALLLPSLAYAEDTEEAPAPVATDADLLEPITFVDPEAPQLDAAIRLVPAGSLLVLPPGEDGTTPIRLSVPGKFFLLPELHYDNALIKAKQLGICQPALDTCTETSLAWQKRTSDALTACSDQFDGDEALVLDLTGQVQSMETRALVAEDRLKVARKNQAVAWAITGGLVLGATTVIVVTVAN